MKTVGIILREVENEYGEKIEKVPQSFLPILKDVSIMGIPIRFGESVEAVMEKIIPLIHLCGGLIFPGGNHLYDIDKAICKYAYDHNIPTLGICCGMQLMALTFGGSLIEAKTNHQIPGTYAHDVFIEKNTHLYKILQKDKISVNSKHTIIAENTTLRVSATTKEGYIEAIEDPLKDFFIGVQWHPELLDDESSHLLFKTFLSHLKDTLQ